MADDWPCSERNIEPPSLGCGEGRPRMFPWAGPDRPCWGWPNPQDGWNILNFIIIFILLVGFFINKLSVIAITYTLR